MSLRTEIVSNAATGRHHMEVRDCDTERLVFRGPHCGSPGRAETRGLAALYRVATDAAVDLVLEVAGATRGIDCRTGQATAVHDEVRARARKRGLKL